MKGDEKEVQLDVLLDFQSDERGDPDDGPGDEHGAEAAESGGESMRGGLGMEGMGEFLAPQSECLHSLGSAVGSDADQFLRSDLSADASVRGYTHPTVTASPLHW